jgi:hypothetical protein
MARKKTDNTVPFWNSLVETYFSFCREKFDESPSFDGSSPRDMKAIIVSLQKRAEEKNIEWTETVAVTRWRKFLEFAYQDKWLAENFVLALINRQKDRIFFRIAKEATRPSNVYQQSIDEQLKNYKPLQY